MRRFTPTGSRRTSTPATIAVPPSARRRPSRISMVEVFPAPFGPSIPKISPRSTLKEIPSTAVTAP
jgi:hypothetical protein